MNKMPDFSSYALAMLAAGQRFRGSRKIAGRAPGNYDAQNIATAQAKRVRKAHKLQHAVGIHA